MNAHGELVPARLGRVTFSWTKVLWLWGHGLATLVWLPGAFDGARCAGALAATYLTLCLGHSVGLHRGLIHRTYAAPRAVARALLVLFTLTGLGSPRAWIRLHRVRDHWQNRPDCPRYFAYRHGLPRDFWWNLHLAFEPVSWREYGLDARLERDRFLGFLDRAWWILVLAQHALLWWLFGFETAIVCGVARTSGGIVGHWFVGYWTHKHGERRFTLPGASEHGSNSLLLGWISFGEGFHNNHHALPDSARMGIRAREFDLGWLTIVALERLGLVRDVRSWSRGNARLRASGPCADTHGRESRPSRTDPVAAGSGPRDASGPPPRSSRARRRGPRAIRERASDPLGRRTIHGPFPGWSRAVVAASLAPAGHALAWKARTQDGSPSPQASGSPVRWDSWPPAAAAVEAAAPR